MRDSSAVRININFRKRLDRFIKEYENKYLVKLSINEATKLIDDKIERLGGLIV